MFNNNKKNYKKILCIIYALYIFWHYNSGASIRVRTDSRVKISKTFPKLFHTIQFCPRWSILKETSWPIFVKK